tara:strand:- start:240 stop:605 length:366 start_codon:yes stop_codon:yes gene_type:complete
VKPNRLILLATTILLALNGAGVLRAVHNLSHHAQPTISQSCDSAADHQTPTKQAPKTPSNQPTDQDCDLCLSLHSITPTLAEPAPLPLTLETITYIPAQPISVVPSLYTLSDHPTRGPPLS